MFQAVEEPEEPAEQRVKQRRLLFAVEHLACVRSKVEKEQDDLGQETPED